MLPKYVENVKSGNATAQNNNHIDQKLSSKLSTMRGELKMWKIFLLHGGKTCDLKLVDELRSCGIAVTQFTDFNSLKAAIATDDPTAIMACSCATEWQLDLRNISFEFNLPLIWMSDTGSVQSRLQAAKLEVDCFVTSTTDATTLMRKLDAIVQSSKIYNSVLWVCEDEDRLARLKKYLHSAGHEVESSSNPESAMEHALKTLYDVVIVDHCLHAEYTSLDLIQAIRHIDRYKDTTVVLLADSLSQDQRDQAIRLNCIVLPRYSGKQHVERAIQSKCPRKALKIPGRATFQLI